MKSYFEDNDGLIDINQIINESAKESNYFISGPPVMIKAFKQTLISKGDPVSHILTDDWE